MSPRRLEAAAIAWLERWLGWPIPQCAGWWHTLGAVIAALLALQMATGLVVALTYCPSPDSALASLRYLDRDVPGGAFVRSAHAWGTSVVLVVMAMHLGRVFAMAAFKPPRRWTWFTGVSLLITVLGLGFTGYLLPWDAKGYFGTRVAAQIAASLPLGGDVARRLVLGGDDIGALTLTRFYAVHAVVLPLVLLMLAGAHLALVRVHGVDGAGTEAATRRFFPDHAWKDAVAILLVLGLLGALAAARPATLEPSPEEVPASYTPRPEWYFLPLFQLLHYFQGPWSGVGAHVIPAAALLGLLAWPWLERSAERRLRYRLPAVILFSAGAATYLALLVIAYRSDSDTAISRPVGPVAPLAAAVARKPPPGDASRGAALFATLKCAGCHAAQSGVDLSLTGDRLNAAWVAAYVRNPSRLRWASEGRRPVERMPRFELTESEAADLASHLDTRRTPGRFPAPTKAWPPARVSSGRTLFAQYQCLGCHRLAGQGKDIGPDLSDVAKRFKPGYLLVFLADPAAIIPGTPMKDLKLWPEEAEDLVAYLMTLSAAPSP